MVRWEWLGETNLKRAYPRRPPSLTPQSMQPAVVQPREQQRLEGEKKEQKARADRHPRAWVRMDGWARMAWMGPGSQYHNWLLPTLSATRMTPACLRTGTKIIPWIHVWKRGRLFLSRHDVRHPQSEEHTSQLQSLA